MNNINMPRFTAEASLNGVTEFYRTMSTGHQMQVAQIIPQFGKVRGTFSISGHDPNNYCLFREIIITVYEDGVGTTTSVTNVCAHP